MRTLIGAIGYRNLRDHSAAFEVLERLSRARLAPGVVLEDLSYNPIALVQWLQEQAPDAQFDRVILISALQRPGRIPGAFAAYPWDRIVPPDETVQRAITEAITGIISLDNTVAIAGYFRALPADVTIVEIEPAEHAFGAELSAVVERAVDAVTTLLCADAWQRDTTP